MNVSILQRYANTSVPLRVRLDSHETSSTSWYAYVTDLLEVSTSARSSI